MGFLNACPVSNCDMIISWGQETFTAPEALWISRAPDQFLKLLFLKTATRWQHLFFPALVIGAPASEKIVSWVVNQSGMCQNNDPRACVLLLLAHHSSPAIWTNPKLFNSALPKVLSSLSQAAPRMESGGENPATGSPRWLYRAPPAQKVQPPLGALGLVWLGRAGPGPQSLQDLRALTWWHIQELSSLSPKADQTPGIWQQSGSQRPERNIGGHSFYSSN